MDTAARAWAWITLKENQDALLGLVVFLTSLTVALATLAAILRAKVKGLIEDRENAADANLAMAASIEVSEATIKTVLSCLGIDQKKLPLDVKEAVKILPKTAKRGVADRMDCLPDGAKAFILDAVSKVDPKKKGEGNV